MKLLFSFIFFIFNSLSFFNSKINKQNFYSPAFHFDVDSPRVKKNYIDFEKSFPIKFGATNNIFVARAAISLGIRYNNYDNLLLKALKDAMFEINNKKELTFDIYKDLVVLGDKTNLTIVDIKKLNMKIINFSNGDFYEGEVKDTINKEGMKIFIRNGYGYQLYSSGETYQGFWENDIEKGEGIFFNKSGDLFWGYNENKIFMNSSTNGSRYGEIIAKYRNGDFYVGTFRSGLISDGRYYYKNGDKYNGSFIEGGEGDFTYKSGKIVHGTYENDKFIPKANIATSTVVKQEETFIEKQPQTKLQKTYIKPLTVQSKTAKCDCLDLSDNPENFIGKRVIVTLTYLSALNQLVGLRKLNDDNYEQLLSMQTLGFYDENDIYNTRQLDCSGGGRFYIRIPKSIHNSLPNSTSGDFAVTGILKNRNTIIVETVKRVTY